MWDKGVSIWITISYDHTGTHVEKGEDGLGNKVEDSVEDHLACRGDDVGTVSKTPGDGVEGPDDGKEDGRGDVSSLKVWRKEKR